MEAPGDRMAVTLLHLRTQLKLFHWQTTSYAEHKALDWVGGELLELNDRWVEAYQGGYHTRVRCSGCHLEIHDWVPGATAVYLDDRSASIRARREAHWAHPDQAYLANILDEIVAALSKASYLLTLS
jgi:hypothetical protein